MPRCEDYPCCGHEPGDCPELNERTGVTHFRCVECRGRLRRNASSSICRNCLMRAERRLANGEDMFRPTDEERNR